MCLNLPVQIVKDWGQITTMTTPCVLHAYGFVAGAMLSMAFSAGFYYFQLLRTNHTSAPVKGLGSPSAFLFAVLQIRFLCTRQKTGSTTIPHSNCNFTKRFLVFTTIKSHYHLNICHDLQAKV